MKQSCNYFVHFTTTASVPKSGYSLWISPEQDENVLADLIVSLSAQSTPPTLPFAPHATLYADSLIPAHYSLEDIVGKVKEAVAAVPHIDKVVARFDEVEAGKLFFQCVYIRLFKEKSDKLLELHQSLRKAFGDERDPEGESYFPHMSLVYGDLEMEQKHRIIAGMEEKGEIFGQKHGEVNVAGFTYFETNEILVVKTAGRSDEWTIEARIPLGGASSKTLLHQDL